MAPPSRRGQAWVRQLRLTTGLILFTFVTTHLLNHALGLISLDAMEAGRWWFPRSGAACRARFSSTAPP